MMGQPRGWRPTRVQALWMIGLGASCYGLISPVMKTAFAQGYTMEGVTAAHYFVALLFWVVAGLAVRTGTWPTGREVIQLFILGLIGSGEPQFFITDLLSIFRLLSRSYFCFNSRGSRFYWKLCWRESR